MDWTDFDADNQARLALNLITRHGRATPLLWLTVDKDELKHQRNAFEDLCLTRLKAILPEGVAVTILADRGFGAVKLFEFLESLGFGYVIRFRGNVHVTAADGETRLAEDWVGKKGRAPSARRRAHCGPPQGRRGGLRPRQGNEGGLASGRQRCDRERVPDRQPLRQTLFRTAKDLLETRPIYHKLDEAIPGHVACSFLALVLKTELEDRLAAAKSGRASWPDVIADLDSLNETEVEQDGKRFLLRSEPRPPTDPAPAYRSLINSNSV